MDEVSLSLYEEREGYFSLLSQIGALRKEFGVFLNPLFFVFGCFFSHLFFFSTPPGYLDEPVDSPRDIRTFSSFFVRSSSPPFYSIERFSFSPGSQPRIGRRHLRRAGSF